MALRKATIAKPTLCSPTRCGVHSSTASPNRSRSRDHLRRRSARSPVFHGRKTQPADDQPADDQPADDQPADGDDREKGPDAETEPAPPESAVAVRVYAPEFAKLQRLIKNADKAKTFKVEEAFMSYLKVVVVFGLVFSSPWILWQAWLFVAAGLYPLERKYVYRYFPMAGLLFIAGAIFCFKIVLPFVLSFLLGFNANLNVDPQIRLSEWISFATLLPLMFGISFQLPLAMLLLERIGIFDVPGYRENQRLAILVIAIISMLLTPSDPQSMLAMMIPLVVLYQFGILLCGWKVAPGPETPFED